MKAIVGVDLGDLYKPALELLVRLGLPNLELVMVHAVEPMPQTMAPMGPIPLNAGEWMEELRESGERALAKACEGASAKCTTRIIDGSAAGVLIAQGDAEKADLIVAGSMRQDALTTMLFGSVARALATGAHQSMLLTKSEMDGSGAINAVFATDHSPYADRCLDLILTWKPSGLGRITVTTGVQDDSHLESALHANRGLAERLNAAGYDSVARASTKGANEAIEQAMKESKSELLIMGAQGHGFIERLFIGSTALHHVMNEPYSVLILRA